MIPLPFILGGGAIAAYFLLRKKPNAPRKTTSGYCPTVSFPAAPSAATKAAVTQWAQIWGTQMNADALEAFLDLLRRVAPACKWDEGATTVILRPGAPGPQSIPCQQIFAALRGHTLGDSDAIIAAELGMQSATPGVAPDGIRKLFGTVG